MTDSLWPPWTMQSMEFSFKPKRCNQRWGQFIQDLIPSQSKSQRICEFWSCLKCKSKRSCTNCKSKIISEEWEFTLPNIKLLSHFSRVRLCATPWTAAYQAPPSMGFSRQEYWSGLPLPSLCLILQKMCYILMKVCIHLKTHKLYVLNMALS